MVMKLKDISEILVTRAEGQGLREEIIRQIKANESVIIDFFGVQRITPSFADEFFGKVLYDISLEKFKERVNIVNATDEIRLIIKIALKQRMEIIANK